MMHNPISLEGVNVETRTGKIEVRNGNGCVCTIYHAAAGPHAEAFSPHDIEELIRHAFRCGQEATKTEMRELIRAKKL